MTSRTVLVPVVALLTVSALAGCSLGNPTHATGGSSPSPTRTDSATSGASSSPHGGVQPGSIASPSGDSTARDFPCNLYSLATVSDLTGFKVVTAQEITAIGESDQRSCEYSTADGSHSFATEIALSNAAGHLQIWSEIENTGAAVPDVGDSAWGNDSGLGAVFGDVYVQADDESDASNESTPLAHIGLDKLTLMVEGLHAATLKG